MAKIIPVFVLKISFPRKKAAAREEKPARTEIILPEKSGSLKILRLNEVIHIKRGVLPSTKGKKAFSLGLLPIF
ncbi:MAG: hypothetical protein CH104c_0377 [Candidatus Woesebacteria bacterium]|nr:MAG: hypothetical protein CH104c_0377 [Candidatus Woesebacteria bacterium]